MSILSESGPVRVDPRVPLLALALAIVALGFNLAYHGWAPAAFLWTIRYVVKQAFFFFTLSYIASPLHAHRASKVSALLVRTRASTGAAFAVSQLSAGACVVCLWRGWPAIIHGVSSPVERVLGCLVFVWIAAMLATSSRHAVEKLGMRAWSAIHRFGMIVIWIAYMMDYLRRTLEWSPLYGVFVLTLLAILALRVRALIATRWRLQRGTRPIERSHA